MQLTEQTKLLVTAAGVLALFTAPLRGTTITPRIFATGAAISSTSPDSVVFGDNSVWVSYQNGADSTGAFGSSTVARYTTAGSLVNTWTIPGNVDGLRIDPTGLVWALQNNDGNSALTVINPTTNATTPYMYGNTYTGGGNSMGRGFDDAVFLNGQVYLSETNPNLGTDPVICYSKLREPIHGEERKFRPKHTVAVHRGTSWAVNCCNRTKLRPSA